jgi:hypothetical protein
LLLILNKFTILVVTLNRRTQFLTMSKVQVSTHLSFLDYFFAPRVMETNSSVLFYFHVKTRSLVYSTLPGPYAQLLLFPVAQSHCCRLGLSEVNTRDF